ncbi:protein phosphatase 1 regulatory subunit 3A-like [Scyliorhinus torazame]|uniref:protein phosphatase 1 regulatory subunit 3A-like n=1 Tax=Scyliorhinus torazame TaxID=75743 RepID=UPI003B58CEA7
MSSLPDPSSLVPALLQVPETLSQGAVADVEEEEEEDDAYRVHLIPRSSPTPRKRSCCSEEIEDPSLDRKVSFADTCGLDLVEVKYFEEFPFPESPGALELNVHKEIPHSPFFIFPAFILPATQAHLLDRIQQDKVEVESIQPIEDDPLSVHGLVRVLNLSFQKSVYVRATLDSWSTHYDHPADYVAGSSDGTSDQFSFRLSFAAPTIYDGARIEFVVRYETPDAVYWANNGGQNYSVVCKLKEQPSPTPKAFSEAEEELKPLKSCLKPCTSRSREQDEDLEETDWDRQDWTKNVDVGTSPNDWAAQVRVEARGEISV